MTVGSIVFRVLYGIALSSIPAYMMRKDGVKYGIFTSLAALVFCSFSGGLGVAAIAAVVLFFYQIYLRWVVLRKLRWTIGTCTSLASYIAAQAVLLPGRLENWDKSWAIKILVSYTPLALSMLITVIEMKVRRVKDTYKKDIKEAADVAAKKVKKKLL